MKKKKGRERERNKFEQGTISENPAQKWSVTH